MRPTPPTTTAGLRPSLRRGGVLLAMLVLLVAVLAPTALAESPADAPPADPPPEQAAEPAQENAGSGDPDAEAGEPDDADADDQTGKPDENAAEPAQENAAGDTDPADGEPDDEAAEPAQENAGGDDAPTREPDDNAADDADGGNENENAAGGQGNRGHVQPSSDGETLPPNNEPHLPCEFFVTFYDMREGTEQATVEFFAQPPSGGPGELLLSDTVELNGDAGEGVTFNGREQYDLEPYVGDLTYHEQQGYHIRLTVTTTPEDVSADQKHHVFWIDCAPAEEDDQPAPADLTVTKAVTGDDAPAADTEFEVTVVCDELTEIVDLTDGQTWSWNDDGTQDDLTEDSTCTVDETVTHGADVTVTFNGTDVDEGQTLDLDEGTNTVTVTNDFPAAGGGGDAAAADLTVTKAVTGDDAPAADTEFEVTVVCDEHTEIVDLTDGQTWSWNDDGTQDDLTEDSTCTVDETVTHGADVTVTFNGTDVDEGQTLDLDEATNTVTVTNDFPTTGVDDSEETQDGDEDEQVPEGDEDEQPIDVGVLPDEVERPAPTPAVPFTPAPAPTDEQEEQPAVAVQDTTAERLPRTGVSSTALLVLALTLLGSGVVALRRTQPATR